MTTLAKSEANKRNGELSTGPRTAEGKVVVSRNATKHGIFAAVPVIPGECPATWEAHHAGVVDSLAPVGLLEVNLAERAALLLWRLQWLARYEAELLADGIEAVDVPALPPPEEEDDAFTRTRILKQMTREEQLEDIRNRLRMERTELADLEPATAFFNTLSERSVEEVVPFGIAESILNAACAHAEVAEDLQADPPAFESKAFLRKLGLRGSDPKAITWTVELIRRGLAHYASFTGETTNECQKAVRIDLEEWAESSARKVRRLEREAVAITRLLDEGTTRKQNARLLPTDGR